MFLYLVHHGDAVGPEVDPRRPLSTQGRAEVQRIARPAGRTWSRRGWAVGERAAAQAAGLGARPAVVWHSGKLRAKQTAEAFWRACNALAALSASRDLQPDDPPQWLRARPRAHGAGIRAA